jgi:hypothetical protein
MVDAMVDAMVDTMADIMVDGRRHGLGLPGKALGGLRAGGAIKGRRDGGREATAAPGRASLVRIAWIAQWPDGAMAGSSDGAIALMDGYLLTLLRLGRPDGWRMAPATGSTSSSVAQWGLSCCAVATNRRRTATSDWH